jgi:hypothetical protein
MFVRIAGVMSGVGTHGVTPAAGAVLGVLQVAAAVRVRGARRVRGKAMHAARNIFFYCRRDQPVGLPARRQADTFMTFYKKQTSLRNVQGWRQNHSHVLSSIVGNLLHWADWRNGNALDLYSGGTQYESPTGHRISWHRFGYDRFLSIHFKYIVLPFDAIWTSCWQRS